MDNFKKEFQQKGFEVLADKSAFSIRDQLSAFMCASSFDSRKQCLDDIIDIVEKAKVILQELEHLDKSAHLERIAEPAQTPRVMKVWSEDCKPDTPGTYWISVSFETNAYQRELYPSNIRKGAIATRAGEDPIEYWLEVEPIPVLPEEGK